MSERPSIDKIVADPEMRSTAHRPASRWKGAVLIAALALGALGATWWWLGRSTVPAEQPVASATPAAAPAGSQTSQAVPGPVASSGPAAGEPPATTAPAASAAGLPALDESDLVFARWLEDVFGREGMAQLRINDFARRFVATVDNLGREQAPARLWPVNPASGRFATASRDGRTVIDADNQLRYAPFVILLESVDPQRLVMVYRKAYPLLLQAYGELGFPGKSFHERLLAVIDHLLAAPEQVGEIEVLPVEVRGSAPLSQPWRYLAFADPALEELSAGQKLMVRMGPVNERRLKQVLSRLRAALTAPVPSR